MFSSWQARSRCRGLSRCHSTLRSWLKEFMPGDVGERWRTRRKYRGANRLFWIYAYIYSFQCPIALPMSWEPCALIPRSGLMWLFDFVNIHQQYPGATTLLAYPLCEDSGDHNFPGNSSIVIKFDHYLHPLFINTWRYLMKIFKLTKQINDLWCFKSFWIFVVLKVFSKISLQAFVYSFQ